MTQDHVDRRVQDFYTSEYDEARRLTSLAGRLELARVRELLEPLLAPASRVIDVGGAKGVHASWLAAADHAVTLVDPVPHQVEVASAIDGVHAVVGDARHLAFDDDSFEAALLFGPLYHLATREDRVRALAEARRVVRPGGLVAAQVITRWADLTDEMAGLPDGQPMRPEVHSILDTGGYEMGSDDFPAAHFHTAAELAAEAEEAGLAVERLEAVEGPAGLALELASATPGWFDDDARAASAMEAALALVRAVGAAPWAREMSSHLMVIARA